MKFNKLIVCFIFFVFLSQTLVLASITIDKAGWSLIYPGGLDANELYDLMNDQPNIESIWGWQNSMWECTFRDKDINHNFTTLTYLEENRGYWFKTSGSVIISGQQNNIPQNLDNFNMTENYGWQLLGTPIDINVIDFFDADLPADATIWAFKNNLWEVFTKGDSGETNQFNEKYGQILDNLRQIDADSGFWINLGDSIKTHSYGSGWHLINPGYFSTQELDKLMNDQQSIKSIWEWHCSSWLVKFQNGNPNSSSYVEIESLKNDQGYWINVRGTATLRSVPSQTVSTFIGFNLSENNGWQLLGTSSNIDVINFIDPYLPSDGMVWVWENNSWKIFSKGDSGNYNKYNDEYDTSYENLRTIKAGSGFWIYLGKIQPSIVDIFPDKNSVATKNSVLTINFNTSMKIDSVLSQTILADAWGEKEFFRMTSSVGGMKQIDAEWAPPVTANLYWFDGYKSIIIKDNGGGLDNQLGDYDVADYRVTFADSKKDSRVPPKVSNDTIEKKITDVNSMEPERIIGDSIESCNGLANDNFIYTTEFTSSGIEDTDPPTITNFSLIDVDTGKSDNSSTGKVFIRFQATDSGGYVYGGSGVFAYYISPTPDLPLLDGNIDYNKFTLNNPNGKNIYFNASSPGYRKIYGWVIDQALNISSRAEAYIFVGNY